jgi:DNA-directed RNA polymerase specialized sigma24 family protein
VGADGSLAGYLEALRDCVAQLQGRPREAIDLHYRDGVGREAIAAKLEMKPDGVKSLLRRTRELLRECVQRKVNSAATP